MYSFVFTLASVTWMLLSLLSFVLMFFTVNNARWIISSVKYNTSESAEPLHPSLGIDTRCVSSDGNEKQYECGSFAIDGLSTDNLLFPILWKISFIFFHIGIYIIFFTTVASFMSCRFQTMFNKSIYNIVGCVQALAGLFFVNGFIFYMGGWGSKKVISFCSEQAAPFNLGTCTLGTAFYYALLGLGVTFISAAVSSIADGSAFRYKVTRRVNAGKKFVCVL